MKEKFKKIDYIWLALLVVTTVFLLWKCRYGFGKKDEALYLLIPHRLLQGDSLLVDEQHLSQMFGFILYPIHLIYMAIFKTTDGILINFRYIFVVFQFLTCIFLYFRLSKINKVGALFASLAFELYAPYNLMALSYNSICYICLVIALTILLIPEKKFEYYIAGALYAFAVLCNPYLAITYFVYSIIVIILRIKKYKSIYEVIDIENWVKITIGISVIALVFIAFVLSRASINDIIKSLPAILNDPEYEGKTILSSCLYYFIDVALYSDYGILINGTYTIVFVIYLLDKKKKENVNVYFTIVATTVCIHLILSIFAGKVVNYVMWPINILGFFSLVFNNSVQSKKMFFVFFIPAILLTVYSNLSSDMRARAITSSSCVCAVISIMAIVLYIEESKVDKINRIVKNSSLVVLILFLSLLFYGRYAWVFSKLDIGKNTYYISEGPYKGIYVTDSNYEAYNSALLEVKDIERKDGKSILILSKEMWMYLIASDYQMATPSAWKSMYVEWGMDILNKYFEDNPKKIPDIIYVDDEFVDGINDLKIIVDYYKDSICNNKTIYINNKYQ